jgi:ubiquinone/menaquinone biosynthesis C-methylase UbiE
VGCGTGALSQIIFEHGLPSAIKGIDSSADFKAYANVHVDSARVTFEVGDAQALPIGSARFDVLVSGLVLNFVPEPQRAVAEMARVARPGGAVAASPCRNFQMTSMRPSRNGKPINWRWEDISNDAAGPWATALNFLNPNPPSYENNEYRNLL